MKRQTLFRKPRQRLYEWSNYVRSLTQSQAPLTRFIYWAHSRSGSHLFADLLNSHPDIHCVTEQALFRNSQGIQNSYHFIDGVSKRFHTEVFGGKISMRQLDRQINNTERTIAELDAAGWKFIVLSRRNLLNQAISVQIAQLRRRHHDTEQPALAQMKIELNLPELHRKLANKAALNERITKLLEPYTTLQVDYEDDLIGDAAQQQTAERVFDFLAIAPVKVHTQYVKTGVFALSDYIINYDELVASLENTPYARYLPVVAA